MSALVRSTLTKQIALDSLLNKLSIDLLNVQIGCVNVLLALFLFVLSLYGKCLGGHGFKMVLSTIVLAESSNVHDDCTLILVLGCY